MYIWYTIEKIADEVVAIEDNIQLNCRIAILCCMFYMYMYAPAVAMLQC